jgi:hypothetical protein
LAEFRAETFKDWEENVLTALLETSTSVCLPVLTELVSRGVTSIFNETKWVERFLKTSKIDAELLLNMKKLFFQTGQLDVANERHAALLRAWYKRGLLSDEEVLQVASFVDQSMSKSMFMLCAEVSIVLSCTDSEIASHVKAVKTLIRSMEEEDVVRLFARATETLANARSVESRQLVYETVDAEGRTLVDVVFRWLTTKERGESSWHAALRLIQSISTSGKITVSSSP